VKKVTVFAPATVANVAVGFDLLGFPLDCVGDTVTVEVTKKARVVEILKIDYDLDGGVELPLDPANNTATVGMMALVKDLALVHGFRVSIKKGIPIGSGMGGSAASSVAALVAANALLERPLTKNELFPYALMGEKLATGSAHPDNVSPCLFGGLTLTRSAAPVETVSIPVPSFIYCVLVHPHLRLDTRESRGVLAPQIDLKAHVRQSANLAGFIAGCYREDPKLIASSLKDVLIEPQRERLIPGFARAQDTALGHGALGCSISGSGPSVFAWTDARATAESVALAMVSAFAGAGVKADSWVSKISAQGARIVPP